MNGKTGGQVTFPTVGCVSVRSSTGSCDTASLIWGFGWLVVGFFFSTLFQHALRVCRVRREGAMSIFFFHVVDREAPPTEVTGRFWVSHGSGSPHLGLFLSVDGKR